ncbi:MAG: iron ABC transporter permease [Gammaproteobacteria bacterium]|nr:iron ABC transporter permease [Gammaproteobacteria bacterium]
MLARGETHKLMAGHAFSFYAIAFSLFLLAVALLSTTQGAVSTSFSEVMRFLGASLGMADSQHLDPVQQAVLENIRLPRIVLTILVGAGLGVSGLALQGLFRNPLADPALIGVSSGAALFASAVIVFESSITGTLVHNYLGAYMLPVAAFLGSFIVSSIVLQLSRVRGKTDIATMLLAGIAINAIAQAGTGLITYLSDDTQLRTLTFWLMGSLSGADWQQLKVVSPLILPGIVVLIIQARALNAVMLGESVAEHLGFRIQRIKLTIILAVSVCVGAAVALTGIIGFVGLVVPHIVRLIIGPNHRQTFPLSALFGAVVLLLADLVSRTVVIPEELPIGIVTSIFGGPFFLWLLMQRNSRQRQI